MGLFERFGFWPLLYLGVFVFISLVGMYIQATRGEYSRFWFTKLMLGFALMLWLGTFLGIFIAGVIASKSLAESFLGLVLVQLSSFLLGSGFELFLEVWVPRYWDRINYCKKIVWPYFGWKWEETTGST